MSDEIIEKNIQLPLTNLQYVKHGEGEPLIMLPATISRIRDWYDLVRFTGQKFTTYFFELPGHGNSTPFSETYSSDLVAQTVEDLINELGLNEINIMGFSFGGILTLKSIQKLKNRVKNIILLAPCVSNKALNFSRARVWFIRGIKNVMRSKKAQKQMVKLVHNDKIVDKIILLLNKLGRVENHGNELKNKLLTLSPKTLEVIVSQMHEVLYWDLINEFDQINNNCFFGMSVYDPLIDFEKTKHFLEKKFTNLHTEKFYFPYHQPPKRFTLDQLNEYFYPLLEKL